MSTLLTPIITQLELDRDRFKLLVNGDENAVVDLEGRSEKSISGQVIDRIDSVAGDFIDAKNTVEGIQSNVQGIESNVENIKSTTEQHAIDAGAAKIAAEGARDQVQSYHTDINDWRSTIQTQHNTVLSKASEVDVNATQVSNDAFAVATLKSQTQSLHDGAESFKDSATQSVVEIANLKTEIENIAVDPEELKALRLAEPPKMLSPSTNIVIDDVGVPITFVGGPPNPSSGDVSFVRRSLTIQIYNGTSWVDDYVTGSVDLSFVVPANTFSTGTDYRWKMEDTFKTRGKDGYTFTTTTNQWIELTFTDPGTAGFSVYRDVVSPVFSSVVSNDDFSVSITLDNTTAPSNHNATTVVVLHDDRVIYVMDKIQDIGGTIDLYNFTVPSYIVANGEEHRILVTYKESGSPLFASEWKEATVVGDGVYYDDSNVRKLDDISSLVKSSANVDITSGAKLFKVDVGDNPVITLPTLNSTEFVHINLHIKSGTGSITFPSTGVDWDGGVVVTESDLGASWTLLSFWWTGDTWIGKIEAKG